MLSRSPAPSMPAAQPPDWDIFCNVIDNYGDIGVCWRLARQLAAEQHLRVRLWVDDLKSFQPLCPDIDVQMATQVIAGVEIRHWQANFPELAPGSVVIEAFGCRLPECFVAAMVQRKPQPVWINLEYLSAEPWVAGCHALSSPHPRLPLVKYFYFPGFSAGTGGLLRERDLCSCKHAFETSPALQLEFWQSLGFPPPPDDALKVSLFAYENPAITDLLHAWETSATPVCCLLPLSRALSSIEAFCGHSLKVGDLVQRGSLELRVIPFVEQSRYDLLLWACDLNFVRGEDSFVRAQWAAKPMVWHIYPQEETAHLSKLDAFLDIYCAELPSVTNRALREFWHAWNGGQLKPAHWQNFVAHLDDLNRYARRWAEKLEKQEDLSRSLARFCQSKL
jgi:uncharacterized repeat protein (TIGR03837 family)